MFFQAWVRVDHVFYVVARYCGDGEMCAAWLTGTTAHLIAERMSGKRREMVARTETDKWVGCRVSLMSSTRLHRFGGGTQCLERRECCSSIKTGLTPVWMTGESAWLPPCVVLVINDNLYGLMFVLSYL